MGKKNRKRNRIIFWVIILAVLAVLFINAGRFLVYEDKLQKSDAIIVLSGDRGERIVKAAALYHQGYGKYFVISGGPVYENVTSAELMKQHAMKLGVPEKAIILENKADSTYENAHFVKKIIKNYPIHSAIVVSSNYHMRRSRMIFEKEFKGTGIKLLYTGAKDPNFNEARWWSNNKSIMITMSEYIKFVGYALGKNY